MKNQAIEMSVLYQGYLLKYDNDSLSHWSKKYYIIDDKTLNLYYTQSYLKFKQFTSTLFFNAEEYQKAVKSNFQGIIGHIFIRQILIKI